MSRKDKIKQVFISQQREGDACTITSCILAEYAQWIFGFDADRTGMRFLRKDELVGPTLTIDDVYFEILSFHWRVIQR